MENFEYFAANYKDDSENKLYLVPKNWVLEKISSLPSASFTYYNPDTIDIKDLSVDFLKKRISEQSKNKIKGCVYSARLIEGFGKKQILILSFLILYHRYNFI